MAFKATDTTPARNCWAVGGMLVNGSDTFATKEEFHAFLLGKELIPTKTGKSLFVGDGSFTATPVDTDFLKTIVTKRVKFQTIDMNALI